MFSTDSRCRLPSLSVLKQPATTFVIWKLIIKTQSQQTFIPIPAQWRARLKPNPESQPVMKTVFPKYWVGDQWPFKKSFCYLSGHRCILFLGVFCTNKAIIDSQVPPVSGFPCCKNRVIFVLKFNWSGSSIGSIHSHSQLNTFPCLSV